MRRRRAKWKPLIRRVDGKSYVTDQEWAEVVYVPNWAGHSRQRADYRFLAIREPLRQLELGDEQELPFPTQAFAGKGLHKLFGVVTNRKGPGDGVIWWLRERCGKSHARRWIIRLGGGTQALATILDARQKIRALAHGPAG